MIIHVMPINDLKEHDEDTSCECQPAVEMDDAGNGFLVIHNSYDGREAVETANEILDQSTTRSYNAN